MLRGVNAADRAGGNRAGCDVAQAVDAGDDSARAVKRALSAKNAISAPRTPSLVSRRARVRRADSLGSVPVQRQTGRAAQRTRKDSRGPAEPAGPVEVITTELRGATVLRGQDVIVDVVQNTLPGKLLSSLGLATGFGFRRAEACASVAISSSARR